MKCPKHTKEVYDDGILQTVRRAFAGGNEILLRMRRTGRQCTGPDESIFKRWWFWVLAVIVIAGIAGRSGAKRLTKPNARQTAPVTSSAPQVTARPAVSPTAEPEAEPAEEPTPEPQAVVAENEIRPEVKAFLDAYEACMDEYVDFMQKYMNADPSSMASMMGDYYSILARYTEFAEKIDAFDESELTNAELAYYLEVTNRVSQKLLSVAG